MKRIGRIVIALAILFSGVAMIPYIDLPSGQLGWQLYAGIYDANLATNHTRGGPGSYFAFDGSNYPANAEATITASRLLAEGGEAGATILGRVMTGADGSFSFRLGTLGAEAGTYLVSATVDANASATVAITLDPAEPIHPLEGSGPIFSLAPHIFMPIVPYQQ